MLPPTGWFGRPHDNWRQLTETAVEDGRLLIRLDDRQVLTLEAESVSTDGNVLRLAIRQGRWDWTEYGSDQEHGEVLAPDKVELHAPLTPESLRTFGMSEST
ncbi:MAG: hypothetical protein KBB39_07735 [Phycicoccus sp.]|nr:hypothetical protein [Phycicoccus sp.]